MIGLQRLVNSTLRISSSGLDLRDDNAIFAVWHQTNFMLGKINPFDNLAALTADGIRGDMMSIVVGAYVKKVIRASYDGSPRKSAHATFEMLKAIKEGYRTVIALDGPAGPYRSIKPGIFYLASRSGKRIVPLCIYPSFKITIRSRWDKYVIPFPFSRVGVYAGKALPPDCTEERLRQAMEDAELKARRMIM